MSAIGNISLHSSEIVWHGVVLSGLSISIALWHNGLICLAWKIDLASSSNELFEDIACTMVWLVTNLKEAVGIALCFCRTLLFMPPGHIISPAELCAVAAEDVVSPIREQMY